MIDQQADAVDDWEMYTDERSSGIVRLDRSSGRVTTRGLMSGLGYAGLLPFYLSAGWLLVPGLAGDTLAAQVFVIYGVAILAFLGGTLWGYAVQTPAPGKYRRLVISNLVALVAAAAGLLGAGVAAVLLLAAGQLALLSYELSAGNRAGWYLRLRSRLTFGVLPAHLLCIVGLMV